VSVTVRLYAGVREGAGTAEVTVEGTTVQEVRDALAEACPNIADRLAFCRFALNDEFVDADAPVTDGAEVDVIPPVSGG